jgi:hypothetical protein
VGNSCLEGREINVLMLLHAERDRDCFVLNIFYSVGNSCLEGREINVLMLLHAERDRDCFVLNIFYSQLNE